MDTSSSSEEGTGLFQKLLISTLRKKVSEQVNSTVSLLKEPGSGQRPLGAQTRQICNDYTVKYGVFFDSTFCSDNEGESASEEAIRSLVSKTSRVYEDLVCAEIDLVYLEGFCSESSDPFRDIVNTKDKDTRLRLFRNRVVESYPDLIPVTNIIHIYSGCDTKMTNSDGDTITGAAGVGALCERSSGYGSIAFTDNTKVKCDSALTIILHELGHNLGIARHTGNQDHVMSEPICAGCTTFTSFDTGLIGDELTCLEDSARPPKPTPSPSVSTPSPTVSTPSPTVTKPLQIISPTEPLGTPISIPPTTIEFPTSSFLTPVPTVGDASTINAVDIASLSTVSTGLAGAALYVARHRIKSFFTLK